MSQPCSGCITHTPPLSPASPVFRHCTNHLHSRPVCLAFAFLPFYAALPPYCPTRLSFTSQALPFATHHSSLTDALPFMPALPPWLLTPTSPPNR